MTGEDRELLTKGIILFLAILIDVALDIVVSLIIFGVWVSPLWFNILLVVLFALSCGLSCSLITLGSRIMISLIIFGVWDAPLWVRIVLVVIMVLGIGSKSSD